MSELQLSAWKPTARTSIQCFLRSLGIPFSEGRGFWLTNEDQLDYLFHDLCRRGRELKIQLHPQNGGEAQVFSEFVERLEKAKKSFCKHGVRVNGFDLQRKEDQEKARERFRQKRHADYRVSGGKEYHQQYKIKNAARINARHREWYQKNAVKERARQREYYQERKQNKKLAIFPVRRETRPECEKG